MRHLLCCLLLSCAGAASAQVDQVELLDPLPFAAQDLDLMQGGPAWLVGDHVKARRYFRAAAQRGHPLGQYNLAMMLLYHEGGPCDSAEAVALLHRAAVGGLGLAREALDQMEMRGVGCPGLRRPFPCLTLSRHRDQRVPRSYRLPNARSHLERQSSSNALRRSGRHGLAISLGMFATGPLLARREPSLDDLRTQQQ